jgi:aryl-alcohol dehydrogenase-like predicted oxidoreductase
VKPNLPSASTAYRRSEHPGLHSILDKLHRRESISEDERQQLKRHIEELEQRNRAEQEEFARVEAPVGTAMENMLSGHASREGTERFAARSGQEAASFYRVAQDVFLSNIGIGTYRGARDNRTDTAYVGALHAALQSGINLIDTSINYREQRAERNVGEAVRLFVARSGGRRDEIVVCTKGGFMVPGAIRADTIGTEKIVGATHCMAPAFLADQMERSRRNLGLETIDVYYLHNPEVQLEFVDAHEFMNRMNAAFEYLERAVANRFIQFYGTATWHGYIGGGLSLTAIAEIARRIAGDNHHFRFIQLPFNLGMQEAQTFALEGDKSVLDVAAELGITVVASASLLQGRLSQNLPVEIASMLPELTTDSQRAIQFTRSTPGISSALVGMRNAAHVTENAALRTIPPLTFAEYQRYCSIVD